MKTRNLTLIGALVIQGLAVSSQALQPEVLYEFQQGPRYPSSKPVQAHDGSI